MNRVEKALHMIDRNGIGLEIGPSFQPIAPKKEGFNVEIVDHATASDLRIKYQGHIGVNIDNIEEVDYVWKGEPLDKLIGKSEAYDYIIASHVIEHITDFIGFLQQCSTLLKPTGILSLIIPDKRYCFDYFRFPSSSGDVLQAYFEKRSRHTPGVIFDHFISACSLNGQIAWGKGFSGELDLIHNIVQASEFMELAKSNDSGYIDCHQWRFTPSSLKLILLDIQQLDLVTLQEISSFDSEGCEFHISLGKDRVKTSKQLDRFDLFKAIMNEIASSQIL
jgi:hypothetical protein